MIFEMLAALLPSRNDNLQPFLHISTETTNIANPQNHFLCYRCYRFCLAQEQQINHTHIISNIGHAGAILGPHRLKFREACKTPKTTVIGRFARVQKRHPRCYTPQFAHLTANIATRLYCRCNLAIGRFDWCQWTSAIPCSFGCLCRRFLQNMRLILLWLEKVQKFHHR